MISWFRRFFLRRGEQDTPPPPVSFSARFHRFKLFLSAHIEAYSEMMTFEERLAGRLPIGMPFLRMCTAKMTVATMQCVLHLDTLGEGRYGRLNAPFAALRADIQQILSQGLPVVEGPLVLPFTALHEELHDLVTPGLRKLAAIAAMYPHYVPQGFIVTGAAWRRYFDDPDMRDEIDRIMMISQEDSASFSEAAATIRERLTRAFPLDDELKAAVTRALDGMRPEIETPGRVLLIRCLPMYAHQGAVVMPEQILRTPLTDEAVYIALRSALAGTYRPRAMIYRLKLGIRDRAMPFCLCCSILPEEQARGSAHRGLENGNAGNLFLHVRRGLSRVEPEMGQHSVAGAALPEQLRTGVENACGAVLDCLAGLPHTTRPGASPRHEISWVASAPGEVSILGVSELPDPEPALPENTWEQSSYPENRESSPVFGGLAAYPGKVEGKAVFVRNYKDALEFPIGSILLLRQAAPRWAFLLDFARGAVAGDGTGNGLFARTARRYGRPAVLHSPAAVEAFSDGGTLEITTGAARPPQVRQLACACQPEQAANSSSAEYTGHTGEESPLWLPSGDIPSMARQLAPRIVGITLPHADSPDFRADNCTTFHDFLIYCHDHAVQEMFRYATSRKSAQAPAKQLVCDVPKQFWIINLDDGFRGDVPGPAVHLEEIASLPLLAFWEGFSHKPWDGPPPLDTKGFLSVLFEATANPNLDPASQSTQYTEKNVFLIAGRFCSMRCRFGFHFLSMDCFLGERPHERFIIFQFKGGAANLTRRIRRVHFVAELLAQFDFASEIAGDTLTARLEEGEETRFLSALRVLGYLCMHTRQLDMIMADETALTAHRLQMLEDMFELAGR